MAPLMEWRSIQTLGGGVDRQAAELRWGGVESAVSASRSSGVEGMAPPSTPRHRRRRPTGLRGLLLPLLSLSVLWIGMPRAEAAEASAATQPAQPEVVQLKYAVGPGCPDRVAFEVAVLQRTAHVAFIEADAARVLEVAAGVAAGKAWGEVSYHAADRRGSPRRVEALDCPLVVSALALIAVLALDPAASLLTGVALAPDADARDGAAASDPVGASAADAKVEPPLTEAASAPVGGSEVDAKVEPPPREVVAPAAAPAVAAGDTEGGRPAGRHRAVTMALALGAWIEGRTPDAPGPLLAVLGAGSLVLKLGWQPSVTLAGGWGASQAVAAGPGSAEFRNALGRLELSPGEWSLGRFRVRGALGAELGRLSARVGSNGGILVPADNTSATWSALAQILRVQVQIASGLHAGLELGALEPLRKPYFYVLSPDHTVHAVPPFGVLAGCGLVYRLE